MRFGDRRGAKGWVNTCRNNEEMGEKKLHQLRCVSVLERSNVIVLSHDLLLYAVFFNACFLWLFYALSHDANKFQSHGSLILIEENNVNENWSNVQYQIKIDHKIPSRGDESTERPSENPRAQPERAGVGAEGKPHLSWAFDRPRPTPFEAGRWITLQTPCSDHNFHVSIAQYTLSNYNSHISHIQLIRSNWGIDNPLLY